MSESVKGEKLSPAWLTAALFLAALLPRLYALGTFLTVDEVKWAEGAAQFLLALQSGDLFQTYWHFHPGITITWGSALALLALCAPDLPACANAHVADLAGTIGWLRLSPALLTALGVAGSYLLARRLLDERTALLAALLLAFDPFFTAHSRILNGDAGAAILMTLALLAYLGGEGTRESRPSPKGRGVGGEGLLLASGGLAGLALLTKLPAPLIGPFVAGWWLWLWRKNLRHWLVTTTIWGGVALLVFVLLWPAMWVAPVETLRLMYRDAFVIGEIGAGHQTFFRGQILDDPGPGFYPYAIAFRLTPVVMVGLVAWLWGVRRLTPPERQTAGTMAAFVIFIILFAGVSPKKLDRYVMPVIPPLILLAGLGWSKLASKFASRTSTLVLGGVVAFQLLSLLGAAPYYLTYYNPLLGGPRQAATQVLVGWGEGLEQAAAYLNGLPNAEKLAVSSWYGGIFHPYFKGREASFSDDGRGQLASDYVVFYINQIQRQKPFPGLIDYFRAQEPAFVVTVDGVQWVEVYKAPAAQSAGGAPKVEGVAQLLAYKFQAPRLSSGTEVPLTLFWRVLGPLPAGTTFGVALSPEENKSPPPPLSHGERGMGGEGLFSTTSVKGEWREGQIVEWHGTLTLPPPGDYRLRVAFQFEGGAVITELPMSEKDPPVRVE
jgi:hypothetical protein